MACGPDFSKVFVLLLFILISLAALIFPYAAKYPEFSLTELSLIPLPAKATQFDPTIG